MEALDRTTGHGSGGELPGTARSTQPHLRAPCARHVNASRVLLAIAKLLLATRQQRMQQPLLQLITPKVCALPSHHKSTEGSKGVG